jgi:hypothetical protein
MKAGILLLIRFSAALLWLLRTAFPRFARRNGRVLLGFRDRLAPCSTRSSTARGTQKKREFFSGGVDKKELLR